MVELFSKYKRVFVLLFSLFIFPTIGYSQNWLNGEGGATNDEALDITVGPSGEYYTTGYFTTNATFGTTVLSSSGNSDIFITKYNAAGIVQWAIKAGGSGADRGYSIKTDDAGNLYVTGFYFGTATFEATTISSISGSQDVFIAKYDISGNLIWVRSVGGTDAETGYGITSDHAGNVIVTGQFKGTTIFGPTSLTSVTSPITGLPSFDIFTVKFDGLGNFLWVEQGRAKYDDRGMDVAVDLMDNVFIVGQFSDTIQFDAIHNNAVLNSGYLMKYDSNGNEQWFVKMSAVQTIIYSVAVDQANNVFITGDFKGNLGIFTSPIVYNTSPFLNKIFVAKFSNSGSVLWVENDGSDNDVSAKSIALDNLGDVYITGFFKCKFDEYSQTLGTGIFYSSGYRDVFITKYSTLGLRQWIKHFGGNKDDYCSGIAVGIVDKPVIAGSFERRFNVPYSPAFTVFPTNVNYFATTGFPYCSYLNYEKFVSQQTEGQKDIFVTSPVDFAQAPFDYFYRSGSSCIQDFLTPCIETCLDTINNCGTLIIGANPFELDTNNIGAQYDYNWNTGNTDDTIHIPTTGLYWLTSKREDGCFQDQDSVFVNIFPIPQAPWITDSYSINVNQPPLTTPIKICGNDTLIIAGTHAVNPDSVFWVGPIHINNNDSTIQVYQSGFYTFFVIGEGGCQGTNTVEVVMDTFALHSNLDPHIVFLDSVLQATDTIRICQGDYIGSRIIDSAFYFINGIYIPDKTAHWHIVPSGIIFSPTTYSNHTVGILVPSTGMYTLIDTLFNYCGDSIIYPLTRSFYVIVNPKPIVSLNLSGPANPCPGDSVFLIASSSVNPFYWSTGDTINAYLDTLEVIAPSITDVAYQIFTSYIDTITGCGNSANDYFILNARPYPVVTISPADGIICPNDSVLLTCEPGLNYYWIGPSGDSIGTTQSIYVDVPGYYHCIHTAFDGCIQTSNFVEAKEYNTPYLVVEPGNFICANGNAIITVQASNSALVQWQPPLSGSGLTQTVASGGTYICFITQCGITTIDSIVISQSTTVSMITSSDSALCPGDTLILSGNPGMAGYQWISQTSTDPFLMVTIPGTYILQTLDIDGCYGYSEPFTVTAIPQAIAPIVADTTICAGQSISASALGPGPIAWYASSSGGTIINLGNNYLTPIISNSITYYIQTLDSVCNSSIVELNINLFTSSVYPGFSGDTTLCEGDLLIFNADSSNVNYTWTSPGGLTGALQSFSVPSVSSLYEGYYTLQYFDSICSSPIDSFYVTINPLPTPHISPDSTIYLCVGMSTSLSIDSTYSSYLWYPGGQTTQAILVGSNGIFYASVYQNGCIGMSNAVTVSFYNPLLDPITSDVTACSGNASTLTASGSGVLTWYDDSLTLVGTGTTFTIPIIDSSAIYFVQSVDTVGCSSSLVQVNVFVFQDSIAPIIYFLTPVCVGDNIYFSTDSIDGAAYSWTGPGGFSSSISSPTILNSQITNTGVYELVVSLVGCSTPSGIANVVVNPIPLIPTILGNTVYCEDDSLYLEIGTPVAGVEYYWMTNTGSIASDTNYISLSPLTMLDSGQYYFAIIENGCYNDTTFDISIKPKPLAIIHSNLIYCVGDTVQFYADTIFTGTYFWNGPTGYTSTNQSNFITNANTSMTGIYQLATSLNGCTSDTNQIAIQVINFPTINLGSDTVFCFGASVVFTMPAGYSYVWNDGSTNDTYTAIDSGAVYVTATIAPGCSSTDSVLVDDYHCLANVPNIITPNGDGINDNLYFDSEGLIAIEVIIFDRWGLRIYQWNELNGYWDGRDFKNTQVVSGVYFYIANITGFDNIIQQYKGFVQIQK